MTSSGRPAICILEICRRLKYEINIVKNRINVSPYNALKAFVDNDEALMARMPARDVCFVLLILAETPAKFEEFCTKCGVARHPSFGVVLDDLQGSIMHGTAKAAVTPPSATESAKAVVTPPSATESAKAVVTPPSATESAELPASYQFSQRAREKLDDIMVDKVNTYFVTRERKRLTADMHDIDDILNYNRQCRSANLDHITHRMAAEREHMSYRMAAERQQMDYDVKIKQEQLETHVIHKELARQQLEHNNIQHQATMDPLNHLFCHNIPVPAPTEQTGDAGSANESAAPVDNDAPYFSPGCDMMDEDIGDAVFDQDAELATTPVQNQDAGTSLTNPVITETVLTSQPMPQDSMSQEDMDTAMGDELADDATTDTDIAYVQRLKAQEEDEQRNYKHAMEDSSSDSDDNSSKDSEYQVSDIDKDEDMEEEPESTAPRRSLRKKAFAVHLDTISDDEVVG
jgi:hypothetical protein